MHDILADLRGLTEPFALATVIRTWSSAPRLPGSSMAVTSAGEAIGSVSGGCVEGAVYGVCLEVLSTGEPAVVSYGVSDDDAFEVGLTCGGTIDLLVVRVEPAAPYLAGVLAAVDGHRSAALATVMTAPGDVAGHLVLLGHESVSGTTGDADLDTAVVAAARDVAARGANETVQLVPHGASVFVESFRPPPRMIIFGANDFAAALARMGRFLRYHVVVCDARPVFATHERLPDADEIHVCWPHDYLRSVEVDERTVLCVLTHDPKFDVPLLQEALRTSAGYIGAMGSRRTDGERRGELLSRGVAPEALRRLRSPIGLDVGATTPEETAVSIVAEIVASRSGGTGLPLATSDVPIHRRGAPMFQEHRPVGKPAAPRSRAAVRHGR